jgi:pimeloyl-ACP methyl ester carboxylesterase
MRVGSAPAMARLMTRMPINERAVRAMFKQIGLRQAVEAGRVSPEMIGAFLGLMRDTATLRNEVTAGPRLMTMRGLDERILIPDSLLASVQIPTYFLWGEEDLFGGPDIARAFVGKIAGAELEVMAGAGHAVWLDDCDRAAAVVRRFFG